jgi:hypothetical protein
MDFNSKEGIADFIESHLKELGGEAYGVDYIAEKLFDWHITKLNQSNNVNNVKILTSSGDVIEYNGEPIQYKLYGRYGYVIVSIKRIFFIHCDCDGNMDYDELSDWKIIQ